MSFQKCPVCEGNGILPFYQIAGTENFTKTCPICFGARIIDCETGLPPNNKQEPVVEKIPSISPEQKAQEIAEIMRKTEELCETPKEQVSKPKKAASK